MSIYGEAQSVKELSVILRGKIKKTDFDLSQRYQLLDNFDDLTIIWSKDDGCFYTQICSSENVQAIVQTISISKPPIWEVERIIINKSGTGVLIWGSHGLAVVELPKRWGNPCLFEGGENKITCRVIYVGENLFTSTSKLCVLSVLWYPGCLTNNNVAVLSNDNFFRVYNVARPNSPDITVAIAKPTSLSKERSTLNCDAVTGEIPVEFGFGGAIFPENYVPGDPVKDDPEEIRRKYMELKWPVFVLYCNGDVYYIVVSIYGNSVDNRTLYGPMVMLPAAYDNYGLDYCSLLVLPCSPQVIVIANTSANIHHCIVLEKSHQQFESDPVDSITQGLNELKLKPPDYVLHVYESIKLELSFIANAPTLKNNILLISDPHMPSRYWISHIEGVHGVYFPLVDRLVHWEERTLELDISQDVASCVEHFLCTRPVSSVKSLPVIGLSLNQSPPSVLVLLGSGLIYTFPIPNSFIPCIPSISAVDYQRNKSKCLGDSFTKHIRSLLHRSTSQPLLISGSAPDIESDEFLCMVTAVVKSLKQNYMQPQVKTREELQRRVNILLEQKKNLLNDLQGMVNVKKTLTDTAHIIAERYEEANEKHSKLLIRLEKLMSRLVSDLPNLSSSERAMMNEMTAMKDRSITFEQEILKLKAKHKWQKNEIQQKSKETDQEASLSDSEINFLQISLNAESKRLKIMKNKVIQLKSEADV